MENHDDQQNLVVPCSASLIVSAHGSSLSLCRQPGGPLRIRCRIDAAACDRFQGNMVGHVFSKHSNVAPLTMAVVINPDSRGHLIGSSSPNSECLKGAQLEVTVTGSNIVLAGSDEEGDSMTLRGTVDKTGTLLKASYILNGSATGKCETDDG